MTAPTMLVVKDMARSANDYHSISHGYRNGSAEGTELSVGGRLE